jgi:hypothetical protein
MISKVNPIITLHVLNNIYAGLVSYLVNNLGNPTNI